jgi:hypothetical protein
MVCVGVIGSQVYRLLTRLNICTSRQGMSELFRLMDSDASNTVSAHEFLTAIDTSIAAEHVDKQDLEVVRKVGYGGTTWRHHGNIAWCILSAVLIIAAAVVLHLLEKWRDVLAPLGMAYFFCLLLQPMINLFEQRPLWLGPHLLCHHNRNVRIGLDDSDRICCKWRPDTCDA